ncbi:hypothetical protein [Streptomyces sp. MZ04]|uniref:hypothetical protein n=1 Tax=Streptomyces sp. MZ04 TaxID=2559236 RepID=UPI00107E77E7|nr:hypothetical protein [Streptomyces sp. MZ04]TGA90689.1 hypothetical protein E2651_38490 [Streptomyces sp. MZ04]
MSSATGIVTKPAAGPRPAGGIGQSARDSLVVAKRNLIRMSRIPDRVRSSRLGSTSGIRRSNARKEQAK